MIYEPKEIKKRIKPIASKQVLQKARQHDELVKEAKRVFQSQDKGSGDNGLISIAHDALNINVSPGMIDRALEFFNMLIIGVKRIGGTIEVKPLHSIIIYSGETLEVSLRERQNRVESENQRFSWIRYDHIPSGVLYFKLGEKSWDSKEWKDTAYTVLEDKVDDILEYILKKVIKIQEDRREYERLRLEREKERQQQLELERLQTIDINNFIILKSNAELWKNAVIMREYLSAMEEEAKVKGTYDVKMEQYLTWARRKVDWYDPHVIFLIV